MIGNKETDIDGYLICIMTDCTLKSTTSQSVACTGIYHAITILYVYSCSSRFQLIVKGEIYKTTKLIDYSHLGNVYKTESCVFESDTDISSAITTVPWL